MRAQRRLSCGRKLTIVLGQKFIPRLCVFTGATAALHIEAIGDGHVLNFAIFRTWITLLCTLLYLIVSLVYVTLARETLRSAALYVALLLTYPRLLPLPDPRFLRELFREWRVTQALYLWTLRALAIYAYLYTVWLFFADFMSSLKTEDPVHRYVPYTRNSLAVIVASASVHIGLVQALSYLPERLTRSGSPLLRGLQSYSDSWYRECDMIIGQLIGLFLLAVGLLPFGFIHSRLLFNTVYAASLERLQQQRELLLLVSGKAISVNDLSTILRFVITCLESALAAVAAFLGWALSLCGLQQSAVRLFRRFWPQRPPQNTYSAMDDTECFMPTSRDFASRGLDSLAVLGPLTPAFLSRARGPTAELRELKRLAGGGVAMIQRAVGMACDHLGGDGIDASEQPRSPPTTPSPGSPAVSVIPPGLPPGAGPPPPELVQRYSLRRESLSLGESRAIDVAAAAAPPSSTPPTSACAVAEAGRPGAAGSDLPQWLIDTQQLPSEANSSAAAAASSSPAAATPWTQEIEPSSGQPIYTNVLTNERTWKRPAGVVPQAHTVSTSMRESSHNASSRNASSRDDSSRGGSTGTIPSHLLSRPSALMRQASEGSSSPASTDRSVRRSHDGEHDDGHAACSRTLTLPTGATVAFTAMVVRQNRESNHRLRELTSGGGASDWQPTVAVSSACAAAGGSGEEEERTRNRMLRHARPPSGFVLPSALDLDDADEAIRRDPFLMTNRCGGDDEALPLLSRSGASRAPSRGASRGPSRAASRAASRPDSTREDDSAREELGFGAPPSLTMRSQSSFGPAAAPSNRANLLMSFQHVKRAMGTGTAAGMRATTSSQPSTQLSLQSSRLPSGGSLSGAANDGDGIGVDSPVGCDGIELAPLLDIAHEERAWVAASRQQEMLSEFGGDVAAAAAVASEEPPDVARPSVADVEAPALDESVATLYETAEDQACAFEAGGRVVPDSIRHCSTVSRGERQAVLRRIVGAIAYDLAEAFGFQTAHLLHTDAATAAAAAAATAAAPAESTAGGEAVVLSSVANQVEHLVSLLSNRMDACDGRDFLGALYEAISGLHAKVLGNYERWVRRLELLPRRGEKLVAMTLGGTPYISLGSYDASLSDFASLHEGYAWVHNAQLHRVILHFLIHGEAANLRHVPECLSFIFYTMVHSLALVDTRQNRKRSCVLIVVQQPRLVAIPPCLLSLSDILSFRPTR